MISKASSLRSSGEKESDCGGHIAGVWTTGFVPDGNIFWTRRSLSISGIHFFLSIVTPVC